MNKLNADNKIRREENSVFRSEAAHPRLYLIVKNSPASDNCPCLFVEPKQKKREPFWISY